MSQGSLCGGGRHVAGEEVGAFSVPLPNSCSSQLGVSCSQLFLLSEPFTGGPTFNEDRIPRTEFYHPAWPDERGASVCPGFQSLPGQEITWGHTPDSLSVMKILQEPFGFRLWDL